MSATANPVAVVSASLGPNSDLDAWVRIDPGGTITLFTGKVELGQGLLAAIARIGAEELDVELARIRVETADTAHGPQEFPTVGSLSLEQSGVAIRQAAAEARQHLLQRAAAELDAELTELHVADGTVTAAGGNSITYWDLMAGKTFDLAVSGAATPKPAEEHRLIGRSGPRPDMVDLVTGQTKFVSDLRPAGMLHARIVRPPSPSARLESLDEEAARTLPGVVDVVRDGSFVGVVAEREDQAIAAAALLRRRAHWVETPSLPQSSTLHESWTSAPAQSFLLGENGAGPVAECPPAQSPPEDGQTLSATYTKPFIMHGAIGPSAAVAEWNDDGLTVWTHSQAIVFMRAVLTQLFELDAERVRVIHVRGPGCYGQNGADDAALDAALVARAVPGRPILVTWTREDEHAWEPYGPAMRIDLRGTVSDAGEVTDWDAEIWTDAHVTRPFPPFGTGDQVLAAWYLEDAAPRREPPLPLASQTTIPTNAEPLYSFPVSRIAGHLVDTGMRTSSLRALGAVHNTFAMECFIDELAEAAGVDPLEFRLRHLTDERARAVLVAAAERAEWRTRPTEDGVGTGLAFAQLKNAATYAAIVYTVRVDDETAEVIPIRAVIAADAGEIIDPEGLTNQLEGGLVQATSWTLLEEVKYDTTRITSLDWDSYPILRFTRVPDIETVLLDHPGVPVLGAGEATGGPTAAAIANAVYDAVGLRVRDLPLTPAQIQRAALAG